MENTKLLDNVVFSHDRLSIYNFGDDFLSESSSIDKKLLENGIRHRDAVQIIVPTGEYWLFDYGVVVFWGVDEDERQALIHRIVKENTQSIQRAEEHLRFTFTDDVKINKDVVCVPKADTLSRLAVSHALAQSSKLSEFELQAQNTIINYSHLPEELANKGKISITRKEVAKIRGRLFGTKSAIILHYGLLDTPDFIWAHPEYENVYNQVARYMEIHQRVELLSKKLETIHELFEMLADEQKHQHSSFLEWIIIILIAIEIVIFFVEEIKKLAQ
ncbi:RMD1 family protein [Thalassotalea piscium]|uniref:Putative Rmd1/YagE family protein n=1 Tax=Thalassotalea piscium TaxID=1230533 RepID=A0A7X0NHB4_9GAMM|nr:RMD1 family protein [Thalassotalea piscium]MBB6543306.1 putative Rmd1/YagE family protein [Thalassotalea piscium]